MLKAPDSQTEEHRLSLREPIKQKVKEREFHNALTLLAAVARLVSEQEVASNPKAKAAMDKEWNNLRGKGVWDEKLVRECRAIVDVQWSDGSRVEPFFTATMPGTRLQTTHCFTSPDPCRTKYVPRWVSGCEELLLAHVR